MKLELYTRNLKTGEREQKIFESEDAAFEYLRNRPKFWDVMGVTTDDVPAELNRALRDAMRPLDPEEQVLERQLEAALAEAERKREQQRLEEAAAQAAKHRAELAAADPDRPLKLTYRFNAELRHCDPADPRSISDEARQAVAAWVEERNGWLEGRGQVVGEATLTVYPGPLPDGVTERVDSGSFVPVTGPAKEG